VQARASTGKCLSRKAFLPYREAELSQSRATSSVSPGTILDPLDFRDLFEATPSPYLVLAPDLTVVAVNDAYLCATGRERTNLVGLHIFDAFHSMGGNDNDAGVASLRASLLRVCETGKPDPMPLTRYDIRLSPEHGGGVEQRFWRVLNAPIRNGDGSLRGIIHSVQDVTTEHRERLADKAALRRSEELSSMVLESATEYAIITIDLDGFVRSWHPGAQRMFGFDEDEIVGRPADIIFTPEDRERDAPAAEMRTALAAGRTEDKRWHLRRDGSRFWANGMLMLLRDDDGGIRGFVKILRDQTRELEAEEAAERRARRLAILTTASAELLVTRTAEEALPGLFRALSEEFAIDAAFSFVFDEETGELNLGASAGITVEAGDALSPLGESICKSAAQERRAIHATNIQRSDDPTYALVRGLGLQAYICFPLIAQERLLGTLSFGTRRQNAFSDDDLAFLRTLAQYVTAVRERRRVEEALRASEARLRLAIDAGRMAVWESDVVRNKILNSPELNRLLGFPEDATPSVEELRSRYSPGAREELLAHAQEAVARGESFTEAEFRVVWPDGSIRWLLLRAELRFNPEGLPVGAVGVALDITARKRDEERRRLLTNELNHRVKNTLATMQAVASQTLRNAKSIDDVKHSFLDRLSAMAGAHDILTRESWESADLADVVQMAAAGFAPEGRLSASGPDVRLAPRTAIAVAMALHELATNAVKYGALSISSGRVALEWQVETRRSEKRLLMQWRETGGPPVTPPSRRGFGSRLIEDGLSRELGGEVRILFEGEGVTCVVDAPLPASTESEVE
jgi:PAS domain S-box-containing protein